MKRLISDIKTTGKGLREVFAISKGFPLSLLLASVFGALQPYLLLFFSARIINSLLSEEKKNMVWYAFAYILFGFICHILESMFIKISEYERDVFESRFQMKMGEKILKLPYELAEDEQTYQKKQRIHDMQMATGSGMFSLIYQMQSLLASVFSIMIAVGLSMKILLRFQSGYSGVEGLIASPAGCLLLLLLMAVTVPVSMAASSRETSRTNIMIGSLAGFMRLFDFYYSQYLTNYHVGKDIRLHSQKGLIEGQYAGQLEDAAVVFNKIKKMQMKYRTIVSLISVVLTVYVYLFVGVKALLGLITPGDILQCVGCISGFLAGINSLMTSFAMLRTNNTAVEAYFDYMELPEENRQDKQNLSLEREAENSFEFENVSFHYPGCGDYVLKNINLKIEGKSKIAIVGANGSGKTTLVKLLCRLYRPTEGRILWNGTDIWEYPFYEYIKLFHVVFQDFQLFAFSLGENLAAAGSYDSARGEQCLEKVGLSKWYMQMEDGLETFLYRDFEEKGCEVSGGEAQKIAIARAFYRDGLTMVLDEPTAALDPRAEAEIYENIQSNTEDKQVIFISHRLSSCRLCDQILVLKEGELVQKGEHSALLAEKGSLYAQMWHAQAQYYDKSML